MTAQASRTARAGLAIVAALVLGLGAACGRTGPATAPAASEGTSDASTTEAAPSGAADADDGPSYTLSAPADASSIRVPDASYLGWALLDRATSVVTGSNNFATTTNSVESMVKPFIVGDYLRHLAEDGVTPSDEDLNRLTLAIIDSNDPAAEDFYQRGGADEVMQRMIKICGLSDTTIESGLWWATEMSPADAARYGQCIADGRVAGPQWTDWLLDTMKQIRGGVDEQISGEVEGGRWGIIDGLPAELASQVSFKNGWTSYYDGWHVNCLAIAPDWVLAVMLRYSGNLAGAAAACADVAATMVIKTGD